MRCDSSLWPFLLGFSWFVCGSFCGRPRITKKNSISLDSLLCCASVLRCKNPIQFSEFLDFSPKAIALCVQCAICAIGYFWLLYGCRDDEICQYMQIARKINCFRDRWVCVFVCVRIQIDRYVTRIENPIYAQECVLGAKENNLASFVFYIQSPQT